MFYVVFSRLPAGELGCLHGVVSTPGDHLLDNLLNKGRPSTPIWIFFEEKKLEGGGR